MKKSITFLFRLLAMISSLVVLNSCDGYNNSAYDNELDQHNYPPFYVSEDHKSAVLDGIIDSNSLSQFNQMINEHPEIHTILFDQAPGSVSDDVNFLIGQQIYDLRLDTHIVDRGIIASGAVDLFLAGDNRTRGFNTLVGVNAWADSTNQQASDYPIDDSIHDFYINYYLSIGLRNQLANDFYFFSINAADADDIYFLTEEDIQIYEIFTN
ncbi:MAG: hypothetical protein ACSHX6_00075 [Akkermansiaceae bacterium]